MSAGVQGLAIEGFSARVGECRGAEPAATESSALGFARDGFVPISSLTTLQDIALIRSLLDPLFARFDSLGTRAVDIAGPRSAGGALRSAEINEAVKLAPGLRKTLTYSRCRDLARVFLGSPAGYTFDHAIYKAPHNDAATQWHQDEAYSALAIPLRSVHFWIPLQEATIPNGCMWFIPGSHLRGLRRHRVAAVRTAGVTITCDAADADSAVACALSAGSVTAHHPLTLHYSGPNQTAEWRRAWILHFGAYGRARLLLHPKVIASRLRDVLTE